MTRKKTDIATRALAVTLKAPCSGKSSAEVAAITGLPIRTINSIYTRAIERGFEPNSVPLVIRDEWLQDASRSGRPAKQGADNEDVLTKVHPDRYGRERTCADIVGDLSLHRHNISAMALDLFFRALGS